MKTQLTDAEKKRKKALEDLTILRNRCAMLWSTKRIVTYRDLLRYALGQDNPASSNPHREAQLNTVVKHADILKFFEPFKQQIEQDYQLELNPRTNGAVVTKVVEEVEDAELRPCAEHEKLPPSAKQKAFLFPFQERAGKTLYDGMMVHNKRAQLLRAAVGTGKTYIVAAVDRRVEDINYTDGKSYSPWARAYVTRASIKEQTRRVLHDLFSIDTLTGLHVINVEQLRAEFGELMVRAETIVEQGIEYIKWKWRDNLHPIVFYIDESQLAKNDGSQQSDIIQAISKIDSPHIRCIFLSATPFMRVCEAKYFVVNCHIKWNGIKITLDTWNSFAKSIASPAEPEEYSPAAVDRLMDFLEKANVIVHVKGVRPQFKAHNTVQTISFQTQEEARFYHDAWERYERMKEKIEGYNLSGSQSRFLILAQFTIFRKAAELCRAPYFAKAMWEAVNKHNQAACLAINFKGTIRRVTDILVNNYNVNRDDIALIWGGGKTAPNKKQKQLIAIKSNEELMRIMQEVGLNPTQINMTEVDDYVEEEEDPALRLGAQSLKERQREIDRYQSGKARYAMFTFKAGGVGLSLHHTDEFTKEKCRRKKNGWVITEDIPNIPTRQRVCFLAPTFSAIELVQGLGRCPRLTSLSDTPQTVVFYAGTIEERVAAIVSAKLKCLRKVVRVNESWEDVIVGGHHDETRLKELTDVTDHDDVDAGFMPDDEEEDESE